MYGEELGSVKIFCLDVLGSPRFDRQTVHSNFDLTWIETNDLGTDYFIPLRSFKSQISRSCQGSVVQIQGLDHQSLMCLL